MKPDQLTLNVGERTGSVSALLVDPPGSHTLLAFAHGAGANMRHSFMNSMAELLAEAGVATLRYNFPYMEAGSKRPDVPAVLEATVRAAIDYAAGIAGGRTLLAGGKSMGGRMTSQWLSKQDDPRVAGLVFFGFPLHPAGKPAITRGEHLDSVRQPMLFLQGTRDALADLTLIREVTARQGERATLHIVEDGDHSFAVRKSSGRSSADVLVELAEVVSAWARERA